MTSLRPRPGIALPMALLVMVALALLSALALTDALHASRAATLAEDEARARAAALQGIEGLASPPDLAWLCLQPPMRPIAVTEDTPDGGRVERRWWMVAPGVVRVELVGIGVHGARHRRLGWMRPDSIDAAAPHPGCPRATRLLPAGLDWLGGHPEG